MQKQQKPTILFQYSYIKKQSLLKQTIHCYQLSNSSQQQLLPSLITKQSYPRTKIILCIDLSKPETILNQLTTWMQIIRKQLESTCRQKPNVIEKVKQYQEKIQQEMLNQHEDNVSIKPLPIETVIIGCKYDVLEQYDSQNRKWISRLLRYYSIIYNTHLYYCSNQQNNIIISQIRNIFNQLLYNQKRLIYSQKDHLKPIFISQGQDTFSQLNITTNSNINILDIIKKQLKSIYSDQDDNNKKQKQQIDLFKYQEGKIDQLIEHNRKEINKINSKINGQRDSINNKIK